MKKHLLAFALFLFLITQTKAQFILAGQHGAKDYYAAPNIAVQPPGNCEDDTGDAASYLIDMNGDGIMDFKLTRFCNYQVSFQIFISTISSLNNNEVAFAYDTSCAGPMAQVFNDSDTINNNTKWIVPGLLNISSTASFSDGPNCYANIVSDTVGDTIYYSGSGYIGVRVFLAQDTLYGWIKIDVDYGITLTIVSYACNLGVTGISECQSNPKINLYPNPATDKLYINSSGLTGNSTITIYNLLGETIYAMDANSKQETVNCSSFPSGIYFLQMKTESGVVTKKFVKE